MVPRWGDPEGVRNGHKVFFQFSNFFAEYMKNKGKKREKKGEKLFFSKSFRSSS